MDKQCHRPEDRVNETLNKIPQAILTERHDSKLRKHKNCSVCGISFTCGPMEEGQRCWCSDFPAIMPLDFGQDCRCPECLKNVVREKVGEFIKTLASENAVKSIAKNYVGNGNLVEGNDYYIENGQWVFTEWYLLKQGHCCNNDCKHCPYI